MKRNLFYLAAALIISTAMTSCLKGGDDNSQQSNYHTVTDAEHSAIVQKIRKSYTGFFRYVNTSLKVDSLASSVTFVTDSTAMVDFPVSILANYLTGNNSLLQAREAALKASNSTIECAISIPYLIQNEYWTTYYSQGSYPRILFYPKQTVAKFSAYDHTFELTFNLQYLVYLYETYEPYLWYYNDQISATLLLSSVKVDNSQTVYINEPAVFIGKAK